MAEPFYTPSQLRNIPPDSEFNTLWNKANNAGLSPGETTRLNELMRAQSEPIKARMSQYKATSGKLPVQPEWESAAQKAPGGYKPPTPQPGLLSRMVPYAGKVASGLSSGAIPTIAASIASNINARENPVNYASDQELIYMAEANPVFYANNKARVDAAFASLRNNRGFNIESQQPQIPSQPKAKPKPVPETPLGGPQNFNRAKTEFTPMQAAQSNAGVAATRSGGKLLPTPQYVMTNGETPELPPIVRGQTTQLPNRVSLVPGQGNWTRVEEQYQTPYTVYGQNGQTGTATFTGGRPAATQGTLSILQGPGNAPPGSTQEEASALNIAAYNRQADAQRELNDAYRRYQGLPTDTELAQQRMMPQAPDFSEANKYYAKAQQVFESIPSGPYSKISKSERKAMVEYAQMLVNTGNAVAERANSVFQQQTGAAQNQQQAQQAAERQRATEAYHNRSLALQEGQYKTAQQRAEDTNQLGLLRARQQAIKGYWNDKRNLEKDARAAAEKSAEDFDPIKFEKSFMKTRGILLGDRVVDFNKAFTAWKSSPENKDKTEDDFVAVLREGNFYQQTYPTPEMPQPYVQPGE